MTENQGTPSPVKRFVPWLIAIVTGVGIGMGWTWWSSAGDPPDAASTSVAAGAGTEIPAPGTASKVGPAMPARRTAGPPMALAISNRNCDWGADYQGYYQQAAAIMAQATARSGQETASVRMRVPDRPWNGLTVTAVEAIHEGAGIIFAEPLAEVRAALLASGVRVAEGGGIPVESFAGAAQAISTTSGSAVRYGATALTCGA